MNNMMRRLLCDCGQAGRLNFRFGLEFGCILFNFSICSSICTLHLALVTP